MSHESTKAPKPTPRQGHKKKMSAEAQAGQFVDNRTASKKVRGHRDMVDNSPQVKRVARIQRMADQRAVVQRTVDLSSATERTANDQYILKSGDRSTLYGAAGAADPRPTGLFSKGADKDEKANPLQVWIPNAKFIKTANQLPNGSEDPEFPDTYMDHNGTEFNNEPRNQYLAEILDSVEKPELRQGFSHPTLGIVGPNDCGKFALLLRQMIQAEGRAPGAQVENGLAVGDQMTHQFQGEWACNHHSATVVANDGADVITLEANAGQKQLTRPQMFVRHGVQGFIDDNKGPADRALGNNVAINDEDRTADYLANSPSLLARIKDGMHEAIPLASIDTSAPPARGKKKCYLTTACVRYRGLPDDCEELTVLRSFRDTYIRGINGGGEMISLYYNKAPAIVAAIDKQPDPSPTYARIYQTVDACVKDIKAGNSRSALNRYMTMVRILDEEFLLTAEPVWLHG